MPLFFAAALSAALFVGCARPTSTLKLTSYTEAHSPETYAVDMTECAYSLAAGGDYHIVARTSREPASGGGPIEQLLHVHLFWKPLPGKTFDDPTSVDATIRYAIVTDQGSVVYTGTGFVYPQKQRWSDDIVVSIEGARLALSSQAGDAPILFEQARLEGTLVATNDPSVTVDLRRRIDVRAGPRD